MLLESIAKGGQRSQGDLALYWNQVYFLSPEVPWVWTGGGSVEGGNDFFRVSKVQSAHAQQAGATRGAILVQTSNVVLLCARQEQQWMAREHMGGLCRIIGLI